MREPHSGRDIDAVAFDFDGTLADTTAAILLSAQRTLVSLALPPCEPASLLGLIGIPLRDAFRGVGVPEAQLSAAVERYREVFPEAAAHVGVFPGAHACLRRLASLGLRLGVVSSRGRSSLLDLVERLELLPHFEVVLGEEDAVARKPAPDLVFELATRLGVEPSRVLVVGDTTYDIEMGHAAGALTCAVTYGNHDAARLEGSRPHHRLGSLDELATWLSP